MQAQSKAQSGASAVRKSQGHGQTAAALETDHIGKKPAEEAIPDIPESQPRAGAPIEVEPSLKEVLQAINSCKFSLGEPFDQLSFVRHDLQKVRERTTTLGG